MKKKLVNYPKGRFVDYDKLPEQIKKHLGLKDFYEKTKFFYRECEDFCVLSARNEKLQFEVSAYLFKNPKHPEDELTEKDYMKLIGRLKFNYLIREQNVLKEKFINNILIGVKL